MECKAKTMYKVGDKVRILDADGIGAGFDLETGKEYPIGEVDCVGDIYVIDGAGDKLIIAENELKYIEKVEESDAKMTQFKVGDKVRVIARGAAGLPIGTVAKVTKVKESGDVFLDATNVFGNRAFYLQRNVELVESKPTKNQRLTSAEQAVQPSEAVVGMHVRTRSTSGGYNDTCPTFVTGIRDGYPAFDDGTYSSLYDITNDTEAQY